MPAQIGDQNALVHGGEGAIKRLTSGDPFATTTHQIYLEKLADMGLSENNLQGTIGLLAKETARQFTVSELFWQAMLGAASDGNIENFERYARRFGWISSKAAKSMDAYFEVMKDNRVVDYEAVLKAGHDD